MILDPPNPQAPLGGDWLANPAWAVVSEASGPWGRIVHGTLRRGRHDAEGKLRPEGKLPFVEFMRLAAPQLRKLAAPLAGELAEPLSVIGADQVHGDRVELIRDTARIEAGPARLAFEDAADLPSLRVYEFPETDAIVTTRPQTLLVIQTADCLPILMLDRKTGAIGACHCGWRGLLAGLAQKTAGRLIELGTMPADLEAWIGPGIGPEHYEVSPDMIAQFETEFPEGPVTPGRRRLDLKAVALASLRRAGLGAGSITDCGRCTFSEAGAWHSYRRDGDKAGRLITVIGRISQ